MDKVEEVLRFGCMDILNKYKGRQVTNDIINDIKEEVTKLFINYIPRDKFKISTYVDKENGEIRFRPLNQETLNLFKKIYD